MKFIVDTGDLDTNKEMLELSLESTYAYPINVTEMEKECKIIEEGQNKSAKEIIRMERVLREAIRAYFKRLCCYYDANCEEKAFRLDIDIEGTMGLSSLQSIKYLAVYEDDEGIVRFSCGIYDEDAAWEEIDDYTIETLTYIISELENVLDFL